MIPEKIRRLLNKSDTAVIIFLISLMVFLSGLSSLAFAENEPEGNSFVTPENSALIYGYVGYGYYRWKMMSMESIVSAFSSDIPTYGMKFEHESTPYIVKKYGLKTNFLIFSLGLDYFGNKLDFPFVHDSGEELEEDESKRAKQLRYLSGLSFGNLSFQFNITHREFNSTITSKGYMPFSGGLQPIYYYPKTGGMVPLLDGDEAAWYTTYTDYEGKLVYSTKTVVMEFGLRYVVFEAPTELTIGTNAASGDILMYTENKMFSLFMGVGGVSNIVGDFYLQYYIPANLSGYYFAENDYFTVESKKPFSTDTFSLSTSSAGRLSLAYILEHLKIDGGVEYGMYYSQLMLTKAEVKKDIAFLSKIDGSPETATSGSRARIEAKRLEFFWGFFLHASAYF